jgi:glycine/D-amino acid oxidase-like deaminating enzyme
MAYLRSPRVHHLDITPSSMDQFMDSAPAGHYPKYLGSYRRPSYEMFQAHCQAVIQEYQLEGVRLLGRACGLNRQGQGWLVETDHGPLQARQVVLAIGRTALHYPAWAASLRADHAPLYHSFEAGFCSHSLPLGEHCVVVGGGITAVQTALLLAQRQPRRVTLLMRHALRLRDLDSAPGWMGPKELDKFKKMSLERRRIAIKRARNRGSIPVDVHEQLQAALRAKTLRLCQDEVLAARCQEGLIWLELAKGETLFADQVILATGFDSQRPGGDWLERNITDLGLPCAACGYPVPNRELEWAEGLRVMGPLAELEVGPVAANIIGARLAAERIGRHL